MREINAEQAISILFELPLKKSISTDDIRPIAALIESQSTRLKEAGELLQRWVIEEKGEYDNLGRYCTTRTCLECGGKWLAKHKQKHAPGCRMAKWKDGA